MARGRFVSNSISTSKKFARLQSNDHRLAYLMLLPHVDAEGRHDADTRILNGQVYTLLDLDTEAALADLAKVGLIRLYTVDSERYLEVVGFHEHNKVRRRDDGTPSHEAASNIPAPIDYNDNVGTATESLQSDDGATTAEVKDKVQVQVEVKDKDRAQAREQTPDKPPNKPDKPKTTRKPIRHEFNPTLVGDELPPQFDRDLFLEFCNSRLKQKRPMTTEALKQFIAKHEKHTKPDLDQMFRNAIVAGWLDLYPPKDARAKTSSTADDPAFAQYTERGL